MKNYHFLWGLLLSFLLFSCGGSRNVRYVYVTPPQPTAQQNTAVPVQNSYAPTAASNYAAQPQAQNAAVSATGTSKRVNTEEEIEDAEAADPIGYFRGAGTARSNDYTTAKELAIVRAKAAIVERAQGVIKKVVSDNRESIGEATASKIINRLDSKTIGNIGDYRTVVFRTERGSINQYSICIEVPKKQVISHVKEVLEAYMAEDVLITAQAKSKVNNILNKIAQE